MLLDARGRPIESLSSQGLSSSADSSGVGYFTNFLPFASEERALPRPLDFVTMTDRFYRGSAIAYSAIRKIAQSAAEPRFYAGTMNKDGVIEEADPETDPLYKLILNPNDQQDSYEFMELALTHLEVSGNLFIRKIREDKMRTPVRLELIRPDTVEILAFIDSTGRKRIRYKVGPENRKEVLESEDVIHLKLPDALDEYWGLSPLYVCARFGDIDNASAEFLRTYFFNRGVPSGLISAKGRIQDPDRDRLKEDWRQQLTGSTGWHGIPVFDMGIEFQSLSTGLKDMDLNPIFNQTETRIAMVFGVPPILLGTHAGLQRSTFSNFSESRRGFWTETLVPLYTRFSRKLTRELAVKEFGRRRAVEFDLSKVSGLQENKEEIRKLALEGWSGGLFTRNQTYQQLDMPPAEVNGDAVLLSTSRLYVPESQATQFSDLVGDVITDIVQEEIDETPNDKTKGVDNPNPDIREENSRETLSEDSDIFPYPGKPCTPNDPDPKCHNEALIRLGLDGHDVSRDAYLNLFTGYAGKVITKQFNDTEAGILPFEPGVKLLVYSVGLQAAQILAMRLMMNKLLEVKRCDEELITAIKNAHSRLGEQDDDVDGSNSDPAPSQES